MTGRPRAGDVPGRVGISDGSSGPVEPVTVRRAELADCRQVAEVHVRTWQAAYRHVLPPELLDSLSVDEREAVCRRLVESESEVALVAEVERRVVGFAFAGPSRTEETAAELYAIYVLPEAWGSGAGRELMAAAKAWFLGSGYATAMLWVVEDNPRARRFYEREGWKAEGTRIAKVYSVDIEEALYRLELGG